MGLKEDILKCGVFTPAGHGLWGLPLSLEGPPGSAKTSMCRQFCAQWNMHLQAVIVSLREPSEFNGVMVPHMTSKEIAGKIVFEVDGIRREPDEWVRELLGIERGVVLFDEGTTAQPAVQHAMLRIVLERVVGERQLPPGIRMLMASNPAEQIGGFELNPALANRFDWIPWGNPSVAEWTMWNALDGGENGHVKNPNDAAAEEARVLSLWPNEYAKARGAISGFITRRPDLLDTPFPTNVAVKGHPTPRSWEMFERIIAGAEIHGLSEIATDLMLEGAVGAKASGEYKVWRAEQDLPDPQKLLRGQEKWAPDASRPDRSAAVLISCAISVAQEKKERLELAEAFWKIAETVCSDTPDIVWAAAQVVSGKAGLGVSAFKDTNNAAVRVHARLAPLRDALKAA